MLQTYTATCYLLCHVFYLFTGDAACRYRQHIVQVTSRLSPDMIHQLNHRFINLRIRDVHIRHTHLSTQHNNIHSFSGPFFPGEQVRRYQTGKTNLDFAEARDSEWQWHQLGHMQVCISLQTDNNASHPPFSFYGPNALPAAQPTASKH